MSIPKATRRRNGMNMTTASSDRPTEWFGVKQKPPTIGWYEYTGWMIEDGTQLYWNGSQWGYWIDAQLRKNWVHMAEACSDKWRGLYA